MENANSFLRLQKILSKRKGRPLTEGELEVAYRKLMEFAYALKELASNNEKHN